MLKYLIKRIISAVPIFIGITAVIYILMNMAPGSAVDLLASSETGIGSADYEALRASLGLDKPVLVRYFLWLGDLFRGDYGTSYSTSQSVWHMISQRIGPSILLTGVGVLAAILISLPIGIMAAYKPYSRWDSISSFFALVGSTLPGFFISLLFIYIFAVKLKILPTKGMHSAGLTGLGDLLVHLLMPASIICIGSMGNLIKQTRGACLEVFHEEFVKTARSKGISEMAVILRHGFRNALIPVVTTIMLQIPYIIGGSTITEQIFGWPGIGSLMIASINNRDYPTVMGIAVLIALTVLVTNILLDVIYSFLDPRITYDDR